MTSASLQSAIESFGDPRGYLAVASIGLPPRQSVDALTADLLAWSHADRDPQGYDSVIERTRASYASLVGVHPDRVAQGSQTSVLASLIAAAVPAGAEVLCVDGDFSSIVFPFLQRSGIRVRQVSLEALADSIADDTWLVVFSLVQSSRGAVADVAAITAAAAAHDTYTMCDTTQGAGVLPVDASLFDATVCHTYKWLCAPRGVAFLTLSERFDSLLTPLHAGWYAGDDVWQSCYGHPWHWRRPRDDSTCRPPGRPGSGRSIPSHSSKDSTSTRSGHAPVASATHCATAWGSLSSIRPSSAGPTSRAATCGN
jgi:selenocysteine lyase/cysteine desulfurase